jgi:heterodisulfide reductase subunit A-like polyferredoxin
MDGVLGMEGDGPSMHGKPRHVGVLMASTDAAALDAVMCQIIGVDPNRLALFRAAERRGWWPVEITVEGTPVSEVAIPDFRFPASRQAAEGARGRSRMSRLSTSALIPRPVPKRERCTACRTCVKMCPREAITIVDKLAVMDYERCIRCYCCHEICPEAAIDLKFSWMGRLLRWTGLIG